ncbi:dipeptide and tripeptide permease A [Striga asiatica]|uniref:Dipeptide and tripeptide permease A n=1 Tax=Striga asiatica TaxID=4170 RepID=A0A5A7Q0T5_STRAF|nr:dipeptide and tripeptide permease A [Striga asiatica]
MSILRNGIRFLIENGTVRVRWLVLSYNAMSLGRGTVPFRDCGVAFDPKPPSRLQISRVLFVVPQRLKPIKDLQNKANTPDSVKPKAENFEACYLVKRSPILKLTKWRPELK